MRANRLRLALAMGVLAGAPRVAAPEAPTYVLAGELARVSVSRQSITVKLAGPPPREIEVRVDPATVLSSRGRPLRLADLRPGERVLVACGDDAAGVHHAQRIKLGGGKAR